MKSTTTCADADPLLPVASTWHIPNANQNVFGISNKKLISFQLKTQAMLLNFYTNCKSEYL